MIARASGRIVAADGHVLRAVLAGARVGDAVRVYDARGTPIDADVVALAGSQSTLVASGQTAGIGIGARVERYERCVPLGIVALGRAFDAAGEALDGKPAPPSHAFDPAAIPSPFERVPVAVPFATGVRAIDGLLAFGRGARVGIFGAAGAGKSTLLENIVAGATCDASVVALLGERGREAQRWIANAGSHTTVVCAASDRSAGERIRAAAYAMTQAETLRDYGLNVLVILDSLARFAYALRDRAVALGEPAGRGGYPSSVWSALGRYLERAGTASVGSITLIATVLCDDHGDDPVGEAARSMLDGHLVLSRRLAREGHFPAIDVPGSASRTLAAVLDPAAQRDAATVRAAVALLEATREARELGLPVVSAALGRALEAEAELVAFLRQGDRPDAGTAAQVRHLAMRLGTGS